jgi:glycosyltransferase involved in cell wall biosynthesis
LNLATTASTFIARILGLWRAPAALWWRVHRAGNLSVLYVGTLPPHPGGSAISAAGLLSGLAGRGHRIRSIAPITASALAEERTAPAVPELGVHRYEVPHFETSPNLPTSDAYLAVEVEGIAPLFARLVAEERPDLVFAGRETFARVVADLARSEGLPWAIRFTGATSSALLAGTYDAALAPRLIRGLRNADLRIAPAAHLARSMTSIGVGDVRVVPNAVDLDRFRPGARDEALARALGIAADDVVVAHVANLKALKRPLDVVASAVQALRDEPRLFYLIVGDGAYRGPMEEACAAAGLRRRFAFTGWLEYDRVPDHVRLADIVLVPSESEGQARIYLETQACGRVLLASDIAAAREVVVDCETGALFPVGDVEALAAKTVSLARQPELRRRIGDRARQAVQAHELPLAVRRLEALLRDLAPAIVET